MSTTKDTKIELLTEKNWSSWFVNTRAELRSKKLWEYTQSPYKDENNTEDTTIEGESSTTTIKTTAATKKEQKEAKDWEIKTQEAADLMTPLISPGVQLKLTEAEFNDGYLMLTSLRKLLQPQGSSEFMRLSKEYYTLQFKTFKTVPEYLTHIKVLEEKIDSTKVILDTDNRTILCLSMSLPQEYQYLVQIWSAMPAITAEKARQMILEASRQHSQALHNSYDPAIRQANQAGIQRDKCEHCGSTGHPSDKCYAEHPEIAPDWFKQKMKDDVKGKGKAAERAKKFQARLAITREDDFVDNDSTHISC